MVSGDPRILDVLLDIADDNELLGVDKHLHGMAKASAARKIREYDEELSMKLLLKLHAAKNDKYTDQHIVSGLKDILESHYVDASQISEWSKEKRIAQIKEWMESGYLHDDARIQNDKTRIQIHKNLQTIGQTAREFYPDAEMVTYEQLAKWAPWIPKLESVSGEDYSNVKIIMEDKTVWVEIVHNGKTYKQRY